MRINKKIYTTFTIAILTLSIILATMPMVSAVTAPPGLYVPTAAPPPYTALTTGSVGTRVMVVGVAGDASPFSTVTAYWDSLSGVVLGTAGVDVTGAYKLNVTIPAAVTGLHYIVVNEGAGAQGAAFTVTASLRASTVPPGPPPVRVLPGDSVALTGRGFAAASAVTITLTGPAGTLAIPGTFTTNSTGSFAATITVPSIIPADYGTYTVTATDAATTFATASIEVDYYITAFPPAGPTGITVFISGRIPASTAYDVRVDTVVIHTGTSGADGTFSTSYTIPALIALGGHSISVVWAVTNVRSTSFIVTPAPTIAYAPASGVAGTVVTISGAGFSGGANITLTMGTTVVNSTAADSRFGPTDFGGSFTSLQFTVPTLTPAVYVLTVTDQFGASTGTVYTFQVLPTPVTTVALRGTTYYPGDIFSFNIRTTEVSLGLINVTILDPAGEIFWTTNDWTLTWSLDFSHKTVIYQNQGADNYNQMKMFLPADAPLGTWNWTITYTPTSTATLTKATGLFSVVAKPDMQDVLDEIDDLSTNLADLLDDLEASITNVVTSSEGDLTAVINTKAGQITTRLDVLEPKLQGIEDTCVIIATMLGEVQVDLAALDLDAMAVDITAIKGDTATIKTNIGTVTASVSALDAKVTAISGDVATVKTTLGTLEGRVTSIEGTVATIDTDVGTIQADVSDILAKPDVDMTPVWIAVVLSLIAAIAAIFAVITIRQKIAG